MIKICNCCKPRNVSGNLQKPMKNEEIYSLIKTYTNVKKSFDSLLTISHDVITFREQKLESLNEKLVKAGLKSVN